MLDSAPRTPTTKRTSQRIGYSTRGCRCGRRRHRSGSDNIPLLQSLDNFGVARIADPNLDGDRPEYGPLRSYRGLFLFDEVHGRRSGS